MNERTFITCMLSRPNALRVRARGVLPNRLAAERKNVQNLLHRALQTSSSFHQPFWSC